MWKAVIFDLDGVITDTAGHHFAAWREIAAGLGFDLSEEVNELLKGVSRRESLEIIAHQAGVSLEETEIQRLLETKNARYLELIAALSPADILPGVLPFLDYLDRNGIASAIGSSSKNARFILDRIGLTERFQAISDGTRICETKPHPEVFLLAAQDLGIATKECLVVEDAAAGIEAGRRAGMRVLGVGKPEHLAGADAYVTNLSAANAGQLRTLFI
jgi:beta-phosphoglucomutase